MSLHWIFMNNFFNAGDAGKIISPLQIDERHKVHLRSCDEMRKKSQ